MDNRKHRNAAEMGAGISDGVQPGWRKKPHRLFSESRPPASKPTDVEISPTDSKFEAAPVTPGAVCFDNHYLSAASCVIQPRRGSGRSIAESERPVIQATVVAPVELPAASPLASSSDPKFLQLSAISLSGEGDREGVIVFQEAGDALLTIFDGHVSVELQISMAVVSGSPGLMSLFHPSDSSSLRTEGKTRVTLVVEPPVTVAALTTVIALLSHHYDEPIVPGRSITFQQLLDIAIASREYHFTNEVGGFARLNWIPCWEKKAEDPRYEWWLYIAFVFRAKEVFGVVSRAIIKRHEGLDYAFEGEGGFLPPVLRDRIIAQRRTALQKISAFALETLTRYATKGPICPSDIEEATSCDRYVLGTMTAHFASIGLWPTLNTHLSTSPEKLLCGLREIELYPWKHSPKAFSALCEAPGDFPGEAPEETPVGEKTGKKRSHSTLKVRAGQRSVIGDRCYQNLVSKMRGGSSSSSKPHGRSLSLPTDSSQIPRTMEDFVQYKGCEPQKEFLQRLRALEEELGGLWAEDFPAE